MKCFLIIVLLLLSACKVGPKYHQPIVDLPEEWSQEEIEECEEVSSCPTVSDEEPWWKIYDDPFLDTLIERALENNPDIGKAAFKILEMRANYLGTKADLYPYIDLWGGHANVVTPSQGIFFGQSSIQNLLNSQNIKWDRYIDFYHLGPTLSWEIDLFGIIRSEADAKKAEYEAYTEKYWGVQLALSADVVREYIDLRGYQYKLTIEEEHRERVEKRIEALKERLKLNLATLDDVVKAENKLNDVDVTIFSLQKSIHETMQRLSTLLGDFEAPFDLTPCRFPEIPMPKMGLDAGVPSRLLAKRPDIKEAERELAKATHHVGSVTAEGLPIFAITGTVGGISEQIKNLLSYKSLYSLIDPMISLILYDAGRNMDDIAAAQAQANASLYHYHKVLIRAVEEVQVALYAVEFENKRLNLKNSLLNSENNSLERHSLLYQNGQGDFLALIHQEDSYYERKMEWVEAQMGVSQNFATLSKALGGHVESIKVECP